MNRRCAFSTCFVDFIWFLPSSQAPNFKWALSINNLMESASEWKGDRFETWTPSKSSETTKDYDRPTDKISLSMSADLAKVMMLGMAQSSWCFFFVLVCLVCLVYHNDVRSTQHQCWVYMDMSLFCVRKKKLTVFSDVFFGEWHLKNEKHTAYSSTLKFPLENQGPVPWHSLASSSCVGPLSQTQHGLSPEIDGVFIWKMEILWGHYACKLQPLCRELCVFWDLKLQWTCHHPLVYTGYLMITHEPSWGRELCLVLVFRISVGSQNQGFGFGHVEDSKSWMLCQFWNLRWKGWLLGQVSLQPGLFSLRVCKKKCSGCSDSDCSWSVDDSSLRECECFQEGLREIPVLSIKIPPRCIT